MTLTVENMEQMQKSIPIEQLSKVFQDALRATAELGFEYIWIDSLCIIQNSAGASDWEAESLTMSRIYRNCVLNISATGFKNGQKSMFVSTESREIIPPNIDLGKFAQQGSSAEYTIVCTNEWSDNILRAPLGQRGWVYQEQVLVSIE
jgi:heterokaryon incompatibility protein (HET)